MPRFDCEHCSQDANKSDYQPFAYLAWSCAGLSQGQTLQIMILRRSSKAMGAEIGRCKRNHVDVVGSRCRHLSGTSGLNIQH